MPAGLAEASTPTVPGNITAGAATNTGGLSLSSLMATPSGVGWKAPDLAAYDTQFAQSLAASRAGIASQFQRALEDITAQEGIANQVVGTLPGRYGQIYDQASQRTGQSAGSIQEALSRANMGGLMSQEQLQAPLQQALQGGRAAFEASVPLTQLGTTELFTRQKGSLAQSRLAAEAPLEEANRQWIQHRQGLQAQIAEAQNRQAMEEAQMRQQAQQFNVSQAGEERRSLRSLEAERASRAPVMGSPEWQAAQRFQTDENIRQSLATQAPPGQELRAESESVLRRAGKGISAEKGAALMELGQDAPLRTAKPYTELRSWVDEKLRKDPNWFAANQDQAMSELKKRAEGKPWDRATSILLAELSAGLIAGPGQKKKKNNWSDMSFNWKNPFA